MDDPSPSSPSSPPRRWLDRLTQLLSGEPRSRDELFETLENAQERGVLDVGALSMMEGVLELHALRARDIMIPRGQMAVLEQDAPLDALLRQVLDSGHSRYPVIGEDRDEVVGILLAKDLLRAIPLDEEDEGGALLHLPPPSTKDRESQKGGPSGMEAWTAYIRPALFVPESKRVEALLSELRASRNHMAMVIDEYGGVAGLVTIEDILEQIVGEIDDEHDVEENVMIRAAGSDRYIVHALTPINDFNEEVGAHLSDEDFDTLGGLVTHAIGHLPQRDETIELGGFEFRVISADRRRLHRLRVTRLSPSEAAEES
ncbi:MAG: CBS domain-containing protein [Halothiobacillaceae bacterium]|nr:MAG: CBS domain-containing protein [Halothiobacillaceae bacterium]